jgi:LemA protein
VAVDILPFAGRACYPVYMTTIYIILGVLALLLGWVWFAYNSLATKSLRVKEAWSDIQVQLKRRYDLIPNLVETVKGYATHEAGTLESVTAARTAAMNATAPADKAAAENMLTGALKSLFAVSEAYPDLKANQNFLHLQQELSDTENKIQAARRFYNGTVMALNAAIQTFPGNIIAGIFSFKEEEFFELAEGEAAAASEPVKVQF